MVGSNARTLWERGRKRWLWGAFAEQQVPHATSMSWLRRMGEVGSAQWPGPPPPVGWGLKGQSQLLVQQRPKHTLWVPHR